MARTRLGRDGSWGRRSWVAQLIALTMISTAAITLPPRDAHAALASGFEDEILFSGFDRPTAMAFAPNGTRIFVAEKRGVISYFDGLTSTTPHQFVDLRENVFGSFDRGILGMAIDPDFPVEPYLYVLYTYDGPIAGGAPYWRDDCPTPPGPSTDGCPASGRLSRIPVVTQPDGSWSAGPEEMLLAGWCQQYMSHSIGDLQFGPDGALYVSGGEGASFSFADYGQGGGSTGSPVPKNPCGDPPAGAGGSLTVPTTRGGALRSQSPRRPSGEPVLLNGTVLRVDPSTGAALPDNPWAGASDPNARRIVGYGLRNPFRFAIRPGTDELWVGDVGGGAFEEIDLIPDPVGGPVRNFGWPCYDGLNQRGTFNQTTMCTSLYGDTANPMTPPYWTYTRQTKLVPGEACPTGSSALSGMEFYEEGDYPPAFDGALFFADHPRNCIWAMLPDADGMPDPSRLVNVLHDPNARPVDLEVGPGGDLFWVNIAAGEIHRITYPGTAPTARATPDRTYGPLPLQVELDGSDSSDPDDDDELAYAWDLDGDGEFDDGTGSIITATYDTAVDVTVRLEVTDLRGQSDVSDPIRLSPGNTPPTPLIAAPDTTTSWTVGQVIDFAGEASDAEQGDLPPSGLQWELLQQHCPSNCHPHDVQGWTGVADGSFPAPDHEYPSYLELRLTATDERGLSATTAVDLHPATTTLRFESDPSGLELAVNGTTSVAPFEREVIVGSANSVTAPAPQSLAGTQYEFTSWSDGGAQTHMVKAPAEGATVTAGYAPASPVVFSDDFETGGLSKWTSSRNVTVQNVAGGGGVWSSRATTTNAQAFANRVLAAPSHDLYARSRVKILSQGSNPATLLTFRRPGGATLASLYATATGRLATYSGVAAKTVTSTTTISRGVWHDVELRVTVAGTASTIEVWLDGARVQSLARTVSLGTDPIGQFRIGEQNAGRTLDIAFDDVGVSRERIPPAAPPPLFSDGFETGDLSRWTTSRSMTVQTEERFAGAWAGRATGNGTGAWVSRTLPSPVSDVYARTRVKILAQGPNAVTLIGVRTAGGAALLSLNANATGKLTLYSGVARKTVTSGAVITRGSWHDIEVHVTIAGAASRVEVWLDGAPVSRLTTTMALGTAPVAQVRLGEQNTGRTFDVAFDEVTASTTRLG